MVELLLSLEGVLLLLLLPAPPPPPPPNSCFMADPLDPESEEEDDTSFWNGAIFLQK